VASFADRDLLFRDCQVVAGTGASAGSLHPVGFSESPEAAASPPERNKNL
jgi:hypothetical protein